MVNGAVAHSQLDGQTGTQYSWGYQYNNRWFNIGTQQTQRSRDFGNLALIGSRAGTNAGSSYALSRQRVAQPFWQRRHGVYRHYWRTWQSHPAMEHLSWSKNLWGNSSLYVSASRDQQEKSWDRQHCLGCLVANQSGDSGDYRQGSLRYRNKQIDTSAGFYGDDDNTTQWADLSGALVLMDNSVFIANEINDAFVLVKTNYPDVTVRYENQSMGRTNQQGYLLVPSISSYYPAKYDIDTLDLPADMTTPRVEQRFDVKRQSGYLLNFPVEKLRSASVILHDAQGQPMPVSSLVQRPDHATEYVG